MSQCQDEATAAVVPGKASMATIGNREQYSSTSDSEQRQAATSMQTTMGLKKERLVGIRVLGY